MDARFVLRVVTCINETLHIAQIAAIAGGMLGMTRKRAYK